MRRYSVKELEKIFRAAHGPHDIIFTPCFIKYIKDHEKEVEKMLDGKGWGAR